MKIVVIGRGVAALGFLDQLVNSKLFKDTQVEIDWVYGNEDYPICSRNSTALVALHGIRQEASALGKILNSGFFATKNFFEKNKPMGVSQVNRYHVDTYENLVRRFGHLYMPQDHLLFSHNLSLSIVEECFVINPLVFLKWWEDAILQKITASLNSIRSITDLVTEIKSDYAVGLQGSYNFDFCVDASGALGLSLGLKSEGEVAVGHYLVFKDVEFLNKEIKESFVLTYHGQNLIYQKDNKVIIFGGTNESDAVYSPKSFELENELKSIMTNYSFLEFRGKKQIRSGPRHKALRRTPKLIENENVFHIIGLYKNGYSVCHDLGREVVESLRAH